MSWKRCIASEVKIKIFHTANNILQLCDDKMQTFKWKHKVWYDLDEQILK